MLEGSLREFALPDVFALLSLTKKSGALRVTADGSEGRVDFRSGEVAYAAADVRRVPLAARLVSEGEIDELQLHRIVAAHASGGAAVAHVLVEILEEGMADAVLEEQITDAVFQLMRLAEGSFEFVASEDPQESVSRTLSVESLVEETARRLGAWALIRERVPGAGSVPTPVWVGDGRPTVELTASQWRLVTLLDGRRTVRDLVGLTGEGELATGQVLAELVEAGLITLAPEPGTATAGRALLRRLEEELLGTRAEPVLPVAANPLAPLMLPALLAPDPASTWSLEDEDAQPPVPPPAVPVGQIRTAADPRSPVPLPGVDPRLLARELASLGFDHEADAPALRHRPADTGAEALGRTGDGRTGGGAEEGRRRSFFRRTDGGRTA